MLFLQAKKLDQMEKIHDDPKLLTNLFPVLVLKEFSMVKFGNDYPA